MSDPRVEAAVGHWGPRFVTNGVPFGDFAEVTASVTTWDDWCAAWSARGAVHEALADAALADGRTRSAAEHLVTAAVCHHFGKFLFVHDRDQQRAVHARAVAAHRRALPLLDPPGERIEIAFEGSRLVGNLRRPTGVARPPLVLLVPGLDSAKEEFDSYERTFLDRGLATFSVDLPGQGEVEYDLPIRHDVEVPVAAVIDTLQARDDVDGDRIGILGVSLGGYSCVRAAAFEPRIRACVSLSGPYDFREAFDEMPSISRLAFQVRSHLATEEEAREHAGRLSLAGVAARVTCPLHVVGGSRDRLIPPSSAQRIAREASGPVVLTVVEGGGHVVNDKPYAYRPLTADWFATTLAAPGVAS